MNYDELERLVGLRNSGALTEAEFNQQKAIVIASSEHAGRPAADPETAIFGEQEPDDHMISAANQNINDGSLMRVSGILLILIGVLIDLVAFSMTTTASFSDTLNIGLLNDQSNLIVAGTLMAVCGTILLSAGSIIREMNASRIFNSIL